MYGVCRRVVDVCGYMFGDCRILFAMVCVCCMLRVVLCIRCRVCGVFCDV